MRKGKCFSKTAFAIREGGDQQVISPLNIGQMSQTVMPPWLVNWPRAISRMKTGAPPAIRQMRYGIRKAPTKKQQTRT